MDHSVKQLAGRDGSRPKLTFEQFQRNVFSFFQWVATGIVVIVGLNVLADVSRISLAGASPPLFYAALGLAIVCALLLMPPVFFRLHVVGRVLAYALLIPLIVVALMETDDAVKA